MKIHNFSTTTPNPNPSLSPNPPIPRIPSLTTNKYSSTENLKQSMMSSLKKVGSGVRIIESEEDCWNGSGSGGAVVARLMELEGECKIREWEFMRVSKVRAVFMFVLIVLSVFGLFVLKYSAKFRKFAFFQQVDPMQATHIFITDNDNKNDIVKVENPSQSPLTFFFKKLKYSISQSPNFPIPISLKFQQNYSQIFNQTSIKTGLTRSQISQHRQKYGLNQHLVQTPSFPSYLLDVMTQPFFLLQYFFCFVFFLQGYAPFSIALLFFSFVTTGINYGMLYVSYGRVKEIAERAMMVRVVRDGVEEVIDSKELVPGDTYIPEEQSEVAADCIVGIGDIYVNQANLTGQSIPIGKFQPQSPSQTSTSKTWIYEGSKILQKKPGTYAIVINTGFTTHRGRIIRKILNRTVKDPDMLKSTGIFVAEVVVVSLVTFFATLYLQLVRDIEKLFVFFKFVDFLTSSAPPPLPIFFNLAYSLSLLRLGWKGISGTQPQKTVQGSQLLTFCFDKTGTLTRNQVRITKILKLTNNNTFQNIISELGNPINLKTWQIFSTCHTTKIINNQLLGDEIDKQMFNFINAKMEASSDPNVRVVVRSTKDMKDGKEGKGNGKDGKGKDQEKKKGKLRDGDRDREEEEENVNLEEVQENKRKIQSLMSMENEQCLEVLRINQFQSKFQSMSVLVRDTKTDTYMIFAKGSPQKLLQTSTNTVLKSPQSPYQKTIQKNSLNGLRTITYGSKQIPKSQVQSYLTCDRQLYLNQLTLQGLVCFENKLKHDTKETITRLTRSNIQSKIITGDNLYIAVETGRRAGIVGRKEKVVFLEGRRNGAVRMRDDGEQGEQREGTGLNRVFIGTIIDQDTQYIQNLQPESPPSSPSSSPYEQKTIEIPQATEYLHSTRYIFAVDNAFLMLDPQPYLSDRIKVFARIPPENKALIIKKYKNQENQYIRTKYSRFTRFLRTKNTKIGMCGDGANDLMALRQADLSIGIQATDASYGSSFTIQTMLDIDLILKQSKCTQSNIIHLYQFYGTMSMFVLITSIILITDTTYFSTAQLMYMNFGTILIIPVTIALSRPSQEESQFVPDANMMGLHNHLIFWGNLLIPYMGILGSWFYYSNTGNYTPNPQKTVSIQTNGFNSKTQSTTLLYILILLIAASNGLTTYRSKPWREPIYTNYILTLVLVITFTVAIVFAFFNDSLSPAFQFQFIDRWNMGVCIFVALGGGVLGGLWNWGVGLFKLEYKKLQNKIPKQDENP